MHSRYVRLSILCVLMLSLVASSAFAARRSSLGGNLLIPDTDDIFFFPQHVNNYQRHVTFDFGRGSSFGSGGMIFGNESLTIGAFAHRSDFIGAIPNAFFTVGDIATLSDEGSNSFNDLLNGVAPSDDVLNWIDVLLGFSNGDTPIGVRFSVGRSEDDDGDDVTHADATSFNVVAGATVNDVDLSGEFSYATAENNTPTDKSEISPIHFSAAARKTAMDASDDLQLGWLGEFTFVSGSLDETQLPAGPTSKIDLSAFAFVVGAGPVYKPHDRTTVAFYGTVEFQRSKADAGAAEVKEQSLVIPGWHLASEVEIASWLQARAALVSRFVLNSEENPNPGGTPDPLKPSSVDLQFGWHTGIGVNFDNFHIDGYLDPAVITTGTDLFGNSSTLFGLVTAGMTF